MAEVGEQQASKHEVTLRVPLRHAACTTGWSRFGSQHVSHKAALQSSSERQLIRSTRKRRASSLGSSFQGTKTTGRAPGHLTNGKSIQLTRSTRKRRASSLSRSAGSLTLSASSSPAHMEMRRKGGVKSMSTACGARWEQAGAALMGVQMEMRRTGGVKSISTSKAEEGV